MQRDGRLTLALDETPYVLTHIASLRRARPPARWNSPSGRPGLGIIHVGGLYMVREGRGLRELAPLASTILRVDTGSAPVDAGPGGGAG